MIIGNTQIWVSKYLLSLKGWIQDILEGKKADSGARAEKEQDESLGYLLGSDSMEALEEWFGGGGAGRSEDIGTPTGQIRDNFEDKLNKW